MASVLSITFINAGWKKPSGGYAGTYRLQR